MRTGDRPGRVHFQAIAHRPRVVSALKSTDGTVAIVNALKTDVAFLALLEQRDVRERIFRWLETDNAR